MSAFLFFFFVFTVIQDLNKSCYEDSITKTVNYHGIEF